MSVDLETASEPFPPAKRSKPNVSSNIINTQGVSECFRVVRTSMYVSLAPCYMSNPINGIKAQHLDPLIMTYFQKARGVVLSYFNIDLESKDASEESVLLSKVTDSSAFSFMWITVDLLIWRPQIGDQLEGFVYMQTASHIGLLVHDTFNASIKFRNIPQDWEFVPSQADEFGDSESKTKASSKFKSFGHWTDASGTKIEGKVSFSVRAIHTSGKMLSIEGTLLSPESELDAQPVESENWPEPQTSKGKHITFDEEPTPEVTDVKDKETETETEKEKETETESSSSDVIPGYEKNEDSSSEENEDSD